MKAELKKITSAIEEYKSAIADFQSDLTVSISKEALASANASKQAADLEDISIAAEEMIDRRTDAARAVAVAELRLSRAKNSRAIREREIASILQTPQAEAVALLRLLSPQVSGRLTADLKSILGEDLAGIRAIDQWIYQRADAFFQLARRLEAVTAHGDTAAILSNEVIPLIQSSLK